MEKAIRKFWPIFVLPTLGAFAIGFLWPFVWGVYLSFCRFTTVQNVSFVGLQNYSNIWIDNTFTHAFFFTAAFTVVSVALINVFAFALALLLTRKLRGTNLFRTVFFMPNLIGGIVLGYIWKTLLDGVLALLEGISGEAISIVPAYSFGPHLSSTVAFFFSSIMVDVVSGICLLNCYGKGNEGTEAPLAFAIILFLLAIAKGILLVNPKLSRWTELSSYMDQDGVVTTKRPRPFVLASSQWACLLLDLASFLLIALGSYLTLSLFNY